MADGSRVPNTIGGFNNYINTTDDHLQAISSGVITNRERLGLSAQNGIDWTDKREFWRDTLYPKYQDPLQSTSAVKTQVRIFMNDFKDFANPLLNIMAASPNATSDDEAVYRFKIGRSEPTIPNTPIEDTVVFEAKPITGAALKFSCRTSGDDKLPSKHPDSDSIQLAYKVEGDTASSPQPNPNPEPEDNGLPNPDSDEMVKEIFTKASFVKNFGMHNKGKLVVIYLRWYHTKRPHLAGPWSAVQAVVIA